MKLNKFGPRGRPLRHLDPPLEGECPCDVDLEWILSLGWRNMIILSLLAINLERIHLFTKPKAGNRETETIT